MNMMNTQTNLFPVDQAQESPISMQFTGSPAPMRPTVDQNRIPSDQRSYPCRVPNCPATVVGAGALAFHLSTRHTRLTYRQYVEQTLFRIFQNNQPEEPLVFDKQCCVEGCIHPLSNNALVFDLHLLQRHPETPVAQQAFMRNQVALEQAYRDIRGWTEQDNQPQMEQPIAVF